MTNMDVDNASFRQVVEDMTKKYGKKMAPFHLPIRENEKFVGYVNVITETGNRWKGKEVVTCEVPEYNKPNLKICRDTLMEAVAETSEDMMERYFSGETFSWRKSVQLRTNVCDGSIVPMSMGSNILCQGVYTLLDDIIKYFPSPENRGGCRHQYEDRGDLPCGLRFRQGKIRLYLEDHRGPVHRKIFSD